MDKTITLGRLTRDPEVRTTNSGMAICNFSLAVNKKKKVQETGAYEDKTTFLDFSAFGKNAENIARFFTKGRRILVEGEHENQEWADKLTGEKRTKLGLIVRSFEFVDGKSDTENQDTSRPNYNNTPQPQPNTPAGGEDPDDSIPF